MKRMRALAGILKNFFLFNLSKKAHRFIARILVYSQVLQLATVVAIPSPGNLNPYLSTAQSQNPVQIASLPYVGPLSPLLTWAQTGTLSNLSLSSGQLGLSDALSWGVNYSNLTGLFLDAQYILPLSEQFALGLLGEYGPGQYRWNGTLGYGFSPLSQMKLSAERLGQRLPFQFDSGNIMQRVHQDAYGLRFQQLFERPFLQGINVGGYYARAANQNLAPVIFTSSGLNCSASAGSRCINYRSIAGATSTGIDAGTELLLTPSTLLSANVYYDRVNYNTQLTDDASNDRDGLGGAISLKQLLGDRLQLWGEASVRKIYDTYQGGVSWLPVPKKWGIELTVAAQHLVFHNNMPNNNSVSLEIRWMPEGGKSYDERFHWQNKHLPEVAQWIRTPAVYMNQVLAIAEQITRLDSLLPSIISIAPSQGPLVGGTEVTITGINFTGATDVSFGGKPAAFTVDSDGAITVFTPPGTVAGPVSVVVTTPNGTATSPIEFTYVDLPTITGISPPSGPEGGGNTVTITGTGFTPGSTVTFGGVGALNVVFVNATTLTVDAPPGTAGPAVNVVVTTVGGSSTQTVGYTYVVKPNIDSISPTEGTVAGGTEVTITGTDFTGVTGVTIGGQTATIIGTPSATSITVTVPAAAGGMAGAVPVVVTTASGGESNADIEFTYVAVPTVTGIDPTSGPEGGGNTVTITGTGFTAGSTVTFGGVEATNVMFVNATTLTVDAPSGTAGPAVDVVVTTAGGSSTQTVGYTYIVAPDITSISPPAGTIAGGTSVTITGTDFTGVTEVIFGGQMASIVGTPTNNTIVVTTPAHAAGAVPVTVTTPGGTAVAMNGYLYTTIGMAFGGGKVACLTAEGGEDNLIAAVSDGPASMWSLNDNFISAVSNSNGAANTAAIVANQGPGAYAADICASYQVDSAGNSPCQTGNTCYADWFLPAKNQLNCLYDNQTEIGGFIAAPYWSSTESSNVAAFIETFSDGSAFPGAKTLTLKMRCVRALTP